MKKIKGVLAGCFLCIILSVVPTLVNAQPGDPGIDPDAPIDGGVSLLVAAGIGYGVKKVRDNRKKKTVTIAAYK